MTSIGIEQRALHQHIRRRTVRLLDLTKKSAGGSAVTVKLGNRHFLATAAHVIPVGHDIRILVGDAGEENVGGFLARHVNENDDVGILELSDSTARTINRDFTDARQLLTHFDQSLGWLATLTGYPSQSVATEKQKVGDALQYTHSFATLTVVTEVIPFKNWPSAPKSQMRPSRKGCDIFLRFDPKTTVYQQDLKDLASEELPTTTKEVRLAGMSGCGIWLDRTLNDGVWRPEPILAGIDNSVFPEQGWARGTQLSRWLALVIKHYKEFAGLRKQLKPNSK